MNSNYSLKIISLILFSQPMLNAASNETADAALLKACMAERGVDNVDHVKKALEQGANINLKDENSGQTPLMASVLRGKTNIVKYLLSVGADTSIGEVQGYTPAHGAGFQGRADIMEVLIEAGLDVNAYHEDGFVPFHRACWGNEKRHADTLRVLLKHGVPYDIKSKDGKMCEEMTANSDIFKVLQEASGKGNSATDLDDDDGDIDENYYDDDFYDDPKEEL